MIVVNTTIKEGGSIQDIDIYELKGSTDAPSVPTSYDTIEEMTQQLAVRVGDIVTATLTCMYQSAAGLTTDDMLQTRLLIGEQGNRYAGGKYWPVVGDNGIVVTITAMHKQKILITETITVYAEHKCTTGDLKCWGTQRTMIIEHIKGNEW
jgi:hypothetical protein